MLERSVIQTKRTGNTTNLPTSDRSSNQSTQLEQLSHLKSHYCSRSQKTTTKSSVGSGNCVLYVGTMQRICLFGDDFYSDSTLIATIATKQCMDTSKYVSVCMWFVLCLVHIHSLVLVQVSGDRDQFY
jgi:hypothetical protein